MTSFSYDEVDTGLTWFDGRPIYQRSFNWNNPSSFIAGDHDTGIIIEENISVVNYILLLKTIVNTNNYVFYNNHAIAVNDNKHIIISWQHAQGSLIANTGIITLCYYKY